MKDVTMIILKTSSPQVINNVGYRIFIKASLMS